jgi:hypothetical protein
MTGQTLKTESPDKVTKNGSQTHNGSFWTSPRKTSLRRWSFYIHFYAGLIAGILFSVVGITGSVLVFVPELRVLEVPGHAEVRPAGERLPLETLFQVVKKSRPNDFIESFSSASERDSFELAPNKAFNFRSYSPTRERSSVSTTTSTAGYKRSMICTRIFSVALRARRSMPGSPCSY